MMFLIILFSLTILAIIVNIFINEYSFFHGILTIVSLTFGLCLIIALIILPINYYSGKAEIQRYDALKETVDQSRQNHISDIERATLTKEIAEYNMDLASVKYWNNTIFDIYFPDDLANLKPLK